MRVFGLTSQIHAQSRLEQTSQAISRALERLGSGSRLAQPRDDIASYSLDVNLQAQIRGLKQGVQNLNDAKGLALTAEEAISSQIDLVQEMRVLALQASNESLSTSERESLNDEVQKLLAEFKRISSDSSWRGSKLIDGTFGTKTLQVGPNSNDTIDIYGADTSTDDIFEEQIGTGQFNSAITYSVETSASSTQTADLNSDGNLDIIYIDTFTDVISVRLGNGNGTFQAGTTFKQDSSSLYAALALGDVNNDGHIDAVVQGGVYLNDGDGSFTLSGTNILGTLVNGSLSDINNDGNLDIWHSVGAAGSIYYQLGDGEGNFGDIATVAATGGKTYSNAITADFNNDGLMDVVMSTGATFGYSAFLNTGSGFTETNYVLGGGMNQTRIADLNRDGFEDMMIATTGLNSSPEVWLNDGDGTFTLLGNLGLSTANFSVADINNDGVFDFINHGTSSSIAVRLGTGTGTFGSSVTSSLFATNSFGGVADLNHDGVLDFYGTNATVDFLGIQLGQGRWVSAESDINTKTQVNAENLLGILDRALENLKTEQSKVSALHSRLDISAASQLLMTDNLEEARSKVSELDYALELAELTRQQILAQAQTAVLAQANLQMRTVIALLADL